MVRDSETTPRARRRKSARAQEREEPGPRLNTLERGRAQPARPKAEESVLSKDAASRNAHSAPARAMPDEIIERFIGIGGKYYFPDGVPAFRDHGTKLTTRSENTEVIRSLIAIAQAREWGEIKVAGSERFRKEAWFAARIAGLEVRGFAPSEFEQERLVRAIARRQAGAAPEPSDAESKSEKRMSDNRTPTGENSGPITGRLVDHGRAPYRHNPKEPMSYYVRIETDRGDREIWGVDLDRAFRESLSRPTLGDEVTARSYGRDPVTVSASKRDEEGRVIGKEDLATHRNRWIIERRDFLAERAAAAEAFRDATVRPANAIREHPELKGSYLQLQAAKLGAERDIRDPEDQARFVARARAAIADAIERGEPLEPVRLRERPVKTAEPERARESEPTR
jgi:Large polyvalent protein-associated domain 7